MKTRKFWICERDNMGQRTGEYHATELPAFLVINRRGCNFLAVDNIHESGYIEPAGTCFLHTSEEQAQRAALS